MDAFGLFREIQRKTSPAYQYDIGSDGSVWLMSPDFRSQMWPDVWSFLFGSDVPFGKIKSLFELVRQIESRSADEYNVGISEFARKNSWMARLAGCSSLEELELKLAAM